MKFTFALLPLAFCGFCAHADFLQLSSGVIAARGGMESHLLFVAGGSRVIQVGDKEASRIYDVGNLSSYYLLTGQPFDRPFNIVERPSTPEIFYIGEQSEDSKVRRYLRGYSLADGGVQNTFSAKLYEGMSYLTESYIHTLSPDDSKLYFAKIGTAEVFMLDLQTYSVGASFSIPEIGFNKLRALFALNLNGVPVLVADVKDADGMSTLLFYDPQTRKNVLTVKAEKLGLGTGRNYAALRNSEFSQDGQQSLLCGKFKCAVFNLMSQKVTAEWAMDGATQSAAKFSADGRFVFVLDNTRGVTKFSALNSASGQLIFQPIVVNYGNLLKTYYAKTAGSFVVMLKDRLLQLADSDLSLIGQHLLTVQGVNFEDLAEIRADKSIASLVTSKNTGEVSRWVVRRP